MYVEGCPTVDNPSFVSNGITQLAPPWALGGYEYSGSINQIFHGWVGDVRIASRPNLSRRVHDRQMSPRPARGGFRGLGVPGGMLRW